MFESILDATDTSIENFVFQAWRSFNLQANDWITAMMIIFVAILGYLLLIGRVNATLPELFPRLFKFAFVYTLVTNFDTLVILVYDLFTNVPASIATTLLLSVEGTPLNDAESINATIDNIFLRGITVAGRLFEEAGLTNWIPALYSVLIFVVTLVVVGFITFVLILSKLALSILLALAPFFIILYLFEGTKPLFEGWLRQTMGYAIIPIITYSLLLLILNMIEMTIEPLFQASNKQLESLTTIAPFILTMTTALLLVGQVLGIASSIGGGFQLSTMGVMAKAAGAALGGIAGIAGGALGLAKGAAGSIAKGASHLAKMAGFGGGGGSSPKGPGAFS